MLQVQTVRVAGIPVWIDAFLMISPTEALHTGVPAPLGPDDVAAPESSAWSAFFRTGRHRGRRDAVLDDGPESRVA
jgi:hypothetical protein